MSKQGVSKSKFLSLVLRHKPETIGVSLDPNGWVDVDELLDAMDQHGHSMTIKELERIVRENDKQRFILTEDRRLIRANQGHSVEVDLELKPQIPPENLYHGTIDAFLESIFTNGLQKGKRHHVHLSPDLNTATKVGQRRGKPVILEVRAGEMHRSGYKFYVSANGVWLTDQVPVEFIARNQSLIVGAQTNSGTGTHTLYRPVGLYEMKLIHESGMKTFPPRLPEQPIFYPVINPDYAEGIARNWNTKDPSSGFVGFVLQFELEVSYFSKFEVQVVGGRRCQELWVPAEEVAEFNRHIVGNISTIQCFRGDSAPVDIDPQTNLPKEWTCLEKK